ncbi:hypothetical protein [Streptomyces sp. OE57]|uniref:hypothetical protein n=1 Tax=Streptomyces lacaronensis TaxID=3379885 RepID=UPI0039B74293
MVTTVSVWLVGFRFRSAQGRLVQHFYVVPGAADAEAACEIATCRAYTSRERALRGGLDIEEASAETREVVRDSLGIWSLADRDLSVVCSPGRSARTLERAPWAALTRAV